MQAVTGEEELSPLKATILGPCKVIGHEYPLIKCSSIDITLPKSGSYREKKLVAQLISEITIKSDQLVEEGVVAFRGNQRWKQSFEPVCLDQAENEGVVLREKGVYLITGGLGGIGLILAEYLAESVQARLILVGRSVFPEKDDWNEWLQIHEEDNLISCKIRKLQELESKGAEILVFAADVGNEEAIRSIKNQVLNKYGEFHGIIHCAGNPGNGMIHLKTKENAENVLNPKVRGTLIIDLIFEDVKLDFIILCSSFNSILPNFGQIDYCAANAFLDAFAHYKTLKNGVHTVSVNWDAWQEVGKTAEWANELAKIFIKSNYYTQINHPLFEEAYDGEHDERIYVSYLTPTKHWVLAEHRINGKATLPGTGYLEMVRAAFEDYCGISTCEIKNVYFMAPLRVDEDEIREVQTIFTKQENEFEFKIISQSKFDKNIWEEHVKGHITPLEIAEVKEKDIQVIERKCTLKEINVLDVKDEVAETEKQEVKFGPRWGNLQRLKVGVNQGLAYLELDEEYKSDTKVFKLHPALLDSAVNSFNDAVKDEGVYLPIFYKTIRFKESLPGKLFSFIKYTGIQNLRKETISFDIMLLDEQGRELVDIEGYTLRKVEMDIAYLNESNDMVAATSNLSKESKNIYAEELQKYGILPSEGVEVFKCVLRNDLPQIVISTQDLKQRIENNSFKNSHFSDIIDNVVGAREIHERPQLSSEYMLPQTECERKVVSIWQEFFGINEIGVLDDFFEMGGDSLKAITIVTKIQKELNTEIPLSEIFNRPTIKELSEYISSLDNSRQSSNAALSNENLVLLRRGSDKAKNLFFVHDGTGEIGGYSKFCNHMTSDYNCWGIQVDRITHYSIENLEIETIAQKYVEKILKFQPEGSYNIGGWSLGGIIAFQMVRLLEKMKNEVAFLAFFDPVVPNQELQQIPEKFTVQSEMKWIKDNIFELTSAGNIFTEIANMKEISTLEELWLAVQTKLVESGTGVQIIKNVMPKDFMESIPDYNEMGIKELLYSINRIRSLTRAYTAYIPKGPISTPVHFFKASLSDVCTVKEWSKYFTDKLQSYEITGDHYSIFRTNHVIDMVKIFEQVLMNESKG